MYFGFGSTSQDVIFALLVFGELAQLARALAWHARGRRFDSDILHRFLMSRKEFFIFLLNEW
jgi:hypothetical protein